VPYDRSDESLAVVDSTPAAGVAAQPFESECTGLSGLRTLLLPYRDLPRPLQGVRRDYEIAARAIPRPIVEQALSVQLLQDGHNAFAHRIARMHSKADPWQRNEVVALLLIGCGPTALALDTFNDCDVETLARQAVARTVDTARQIAELCSRLPSLPLALDHVDLAEALGRLLTWAAPS